MSDSRGLRIDVHVLGLRLAFTVRPWRTVSALGRRRRALAAG
ncbi:hypothetical protein [Mycobacterium sp. NPDC006124]